MDTQFKYEIYISSTPEKVWKAIFDPKFTKKYWQHENVSDWNIGSKWEHRSSEKDRELHLVGKVLEFLPPRRLVLSWAFPEDRSNEGKHSRVEIDIARFEGIVRLTVTHSGLELGSDMHQGISDGWPKVLSSLKSLLETGKALPKLWGKEEERRTLKAAS